MPDYQPTDTINEFCDAERISRSLLYKLWDQGVARAFTASAPAGFTKNGASGLKSKPPMGATN